MAALAALCALASPVLAQSRTDHWVSHGPYMAPGVTSLVADSTQASATLYASTSQGVFRSTDTGNSWQPVGEAFFLGLQISSLSVDPLRPGTLYAIVGRQLPSTGLAKTTDGGETWAWIFEPHDVTDSGNWPLAVDPQREGVLYLGFPGLGASSLSKSTDGGATWTLLQEFPAQVLIETLAADPIAEGTLYAGTSGAGIFKTTDGGMTWSSTSAAPLGTDSNVWGLAIGPGPNPRIYALTFPGGEAFRSDDGAATWRQVFERAADPLLIVPSPLQDGLVYLATWGGMVYSSSDGGEHKSLLATGLDGAQVTALVDDSTGLYVGTGEGLLDQGIAPRGVIRSTDGGETWSRADSGLPGRGAGTGSVAVAPSAPLTIYAGTFFSGLFKSTDGGLAWIGAGGQPTGAAGNVTTLAVDPHDASVVYAAADSALYKTVDGALTWESVVALSGDSLLGASIDPADGNILYVGTEFSGVLKSTDAGSTWFTTLEPGASLEHFEPPAIAPSDPDILYTSVFGQLFKSTDRGATWGTLPPASPSSVGHIVVDPEDPQTLLVGEVVFACPSVADVPLSAPVPTPGPDVLWSTDGGQTWQIPEGIDLPLPVTALAVNPADPSEVYAATTGACSLDGLGLYGSRDGGRSWSSADSGLPPEIIDALSFDAGGTRLYAATGEGVFILDPATLVSPVPWPAPIAIPGRHP